LGEFCRFYPTESDPKLIEVTNEDYELGSFTLTIPSPRVSANQTSAEQVDSNGVKKSI